MFQSFLQVFEWLLERIMYYYVFYTMFSNIKSYDYCNGMNCIRIAPRNFAQGLVVVVDHKEYSAALQRAASSEQRAGLNS